MSFWARQRADRGAVLIHVGVALIGLMAFSVLAVDYGVLWASRRQAQNAADAGALAAAASLAFDVSATTTEAQAKARTAAAAIVGVNPVWGAAPAMNPTTDVQFVTCPPGAVGPADTCVRVEVYRNQERGNALPTYFGRLVGVNSQGVRATATAQVLTANEVKCVRPWAIPDKWWDFVDTTAPTSPDNTWTSDDLYERYSQQGNQTVQPIPWKHDMYVPEGSSFVNPDDHLTYGPSGYNPILRPQDVGTRVVLKEGNPHQALNAGWFLPIDLPRAGPATGGDKYRENITSCNSLPVTVNMELTNEPGNMIGPTRQGVDALIAQDPLAEFDEGSKTIINTCAPVCAGTSPRLVPVPVFNVDEYYTSLNNGRFEFRVSKIIGFFIEGMQGNDVYGRMMYYPATYNSSSGTNSGTFLRTVILVR